MWYDLEQEVGTSQSGLYRVQIELVVFVAHSTGSDPHIAVIKCSHQHVDFRTQGWIGKLFRKSPEFPASGNWRVIIEKHAVGVAALARPKRDRDHLPGFSVVAKAGRVRHADKFVTDQWFFHHQRFRHQSPEPI